MLKLLLTIHLVLIQSLVIQEVEKPSLLELVDEHVTLVDIRTDLEFERGTIAESINIDFKEQGDEFKRSKLKELLLRKYNYLDESMIDNKMEDIYNGGKKIVPGDYAILYNDGIKVYYKRMKS